MALPGWTCAGKTPDVCHETCGDLVITVSEFCDDGSVGGADGCINCVVTTGWRCVGTPPQTCTPICGDGR